jgi:2-polyprenyl-3-methyl-5-hydroxy-6-metoxy-1,4-benzoquinol methylase
MIAKNAVDWHTQIATEFDKKYVNSRNFKERYAIWAKFIDKYSNHDFRVLDLGCGSGIFTIYLSERNRFAIGLDASPEMLKLCQERKRNAGASNVDFINSNINALKQSLHGNVDMIICSSVLEYLDDLDESLKLISSSLKQNGLLIFSMPNKQSLYRKIAPVAFKLTGRPKYYKYVKNVCTLNEIENKLTKFRFTLLESAYYGETIFLSKMLRKIGLPHYSDNLFIAVAQISL